MDAPARDVVLAKADIVERCLARVREEYDDTPSHLRDDLRRQDSIVLNLTRASQAAIDLAMHLVRVDRLGIPQESRDAFALLEPSGLDAALSARLQRMVGFRNLVIHDYQRLSLAVVQAIVEDGAGDLTAFAAWALART